MKIFKDRQAAGQLLVNRLKNAKADLVLGIPRGGVAVASEIAKSLKLPLDILVTRKIGSPNQPELAVGAVDPDGEIVWDENLMQELRMQSEKLRSAVQKEWKELKRREDLYRAGKTEPKWEGKTVILTDDGMATGATVLAAVQYLKRHDAKVILAIPVASEEALEMVSKVADKVVVLDTPEEFRAVGQFYHNFEPVTDEEVIQLLS